jgi:hypothetical protein
VNKAEAERGFLTRDSIANIIRLGSLVAIALGLFAIVSGGLAIYLNLSAQLDLERANGAAAQHAGRIGGALSDIQTSLRDASVVDAARSGSADALRRALRERGTTGIIDVRVLPAQIDEIALNGDGNLDFAATESAIEAIRDSRAEIRVIQAGSADESLVFAQRLPGESGVLLLRLTTSVLTSLLESVDALDFVALAQDNGGNYAVLDATGRPAAARIRNLPIEGSRLVFQWSRAMVTAPVDNRTAVIVGSSGIIVLMIGLLLRRRTRLARYLEHHAPERAPAGRAADGPAQAEATMVLGPDGEAPEERGRDEEDDDEQATVVAGAPDLPEWLRDDLDKKG